MLKYLLTKTIYSFMSKEFLIFIIFSGIAALVNFSSRILFNLFITSYVIAIIIAYICGMFTAFSLNKYFNFKTKNKKIHIEIGNFIFINLIGLVQTLVVSLLTAEIICPYLRIVQHKYILGHFLGIATPMFTSFLGHKYITFGKYKILDIFKIFSSKEKNS